MITRRLSQIFSFALCFAMILLLGANLPMMGELKELSVQAHLAAHEDHSAHHSHEHAEQMHHQHDDEHEDAPVRHVHKHRHSANEPEHEHTHSSPDFFVSFATLHVFPTSVVASFRPEFVQALIPRQNDRVPFSPCLSIVFRPPIA